MSNVVIMTSQIIKKYKYNILYIVQKSMLIFLVDRLKRADMVKLIMVYSEEIIGKGQNIELRSSI